MILTILILLIVFALYIIAGFILGLKNIDEDE